MKKEKTKYKGIKRVGHKQYEVRIRWKDPKTGKYRDKKRIFEGTVEEAHQLQLKLQAEVADGGADERMTLGACGTLWFKRHAPGLRTRTIERYSFYLKRILNALGDYYVDAITPMDVHEFQADELDAGYAPGTVSGGLAILRQISHFAIANRLIKFDFTAGVKAKGKRKEYTVDEPNSLTVQQLGAFLARAEQESWYIGIFVLAFTGMRVGELLGLKWDDIDFAKQRITIRRNNSQGHIGEPKTRAGRRRVAMPDGLREVLQSYRSSLVAAQHPGLHNGWVFSKRNGDPYRSNPLKDPVENIAKAIGLPFRFTPHGLRRTFNSILRHTAPDRVVMDILGHANIGMTAHYTTIYDDEKLDASTSMFELVVGSKREESGESLPICPHCGRKIDNDSKKLA